MFTISKKIIVLALALVFSLTGCRLVIDSGANIDGSGYVTRENRAVGYFNRVQMNGIGNVQIKYGFTSGVTVEADENLQSYITVNVVDNVLVIGVRDGYSIHPSDTIHYTVNASQLYGFTLNGAGNSDISGIDTTDFDLTLNGSGDITAEGSCDHLDVILNGAGNIDAADLCAVTANATIAGSGDITLWTIDYLKAVIAGYGNINYYGDPDVSKSISGYGSVHWMGY